MTLEEQWQNDVNQFGELAYLMYKLSDVNNIVCVDFESNLGVSQNIELSKETNCIKVERKQSAALPFDLAAALAGDAVEILTCNEWLDCSNDYALYLHDNEGHDNKNSKTHLRMKHPRRVGVDYSKFKD